MHENRLAGTESVVGLCMFSERLMWGGSGVHWRAAEVHRRRDAAFVAKYRPKLLHL
jgi:hypothetical protein